MHHLKSILTVLIVFSLSFSPATLCAQDLYTFDYQLALPGDGSSDFLSIDTINQNLYVTHANAVHVINLANKKLIHTINKLKGVRGVVVVNGVNKGFITDGKENAVVVIDLLNFEKLATIPLQGKKPSAIIFDGFSKKVFAFCTDSHSVSVIDVDLLQEITSIHLPGEPEFVVADGKGLLFINLEDKNSIAILNTTNLEVANTFPIPPCKGPFALSMDIANNRLFCGCRENKGLSIINTENKQVITTLPIGKSVGTVLYDSAQKILIAANAEGNSQIFQQFAADQFKLVQTLPTSEKAKTFALDPRNKNLYFSASQYKNNSIVPNSFAIYVYKKTMYVKNYLP